MPIWRPTSRRRSHLMVLAIAATFCAAGLVLYLQHRAISTLEAQTQVILRQISRQTATDVAAIVRRTLDGPVFDTLTSVNHPDLRSGRLELVVAEYEAGLQAYPHVDRFFIWSAETERIAPGEVLFFGSAGAEPPVRRVALAGSDRFHRDPELGRAIIQLARRYGRSQQIYAAAERVGAREHDVFLRLFWTDAQRVEYFAAMGFVVQPSDVPERLFGTLHERKLASLLKERGGPEPFELRIVDEHGKVVFGRAQSLPLSASVPFPMLFYPVDDIQSRLAATVEPRSWQIEVHAPLRREMLGGINRGYWPTVLSVALMLVALGLTVQANRRSAELAQMQTEFVAHVSHQLKTPLSLLSAATETLQMQRVQSPEKLAEYLGTIHGEANRLSSLVQRILEFSRVQHRRRYEFERVDLSALVAETVDAFARGHSASFTFDVQQEGPPAYVLADPAALEQALANLLDNAVKYSDKVKEITVRVRTTRKTAILEVEDRGVGIAPEDRDRIFDRFYRVPGAHRPGFGLGLPIVRELVRAHGGEVAVLSAPGEGSTFRVILPLHGDARGAADAAAANIPEVAS